MDEEYEGGDPLQRMKESTLFDAIVWVLVIFTLGGALSLVALAILNVIGVI